MSQSLLIRGARQLITLRGPARARRGKALGELAIIPDGAVLIQDDCIEEVGSGRRVMNLNSARRAEETDVSGCIVMPGFVDSHTHLLLGAVGSAGGQAEEPGSEHALRWKRRLDGVSVKRLAYEARKRVHLCARHGTTTLEAKTGCAADVSGELKSLRALAALDGRPLDIVSTVLGGDSAPWERLHSPEQYADWLAWDLLPQVRAKRLARFVDLDDDAGALHGEAARRVLAAALALGFGIRLHAGGQDQGVAPLAVEFQAASVDHLQCVADDDARLLAASNVVATLTPARSFYLSGAPFTAARKLIDAGAAVALASGYHPDHCPTLSMLEVIALACRMYGMTPAEAIAAATINAAASLQLAHRIGSLEAGKQADLVVLEVPDFRDLPCAFGMNVVRMVLKRGRIVYRCGEISDYGS